MAFAGAVFFFQNFGAQNVARHQIGRELNAAEFQIHGLSERTHQQGFTKAGNAFEQTMAAGQQSDQQLLDHVFLPDDGIANGGFQMPQLCESFFDDGFVGVHVA